MWVYQLLFFACEMIGTVACALSAAMMAIDSKLDIFGVLFIGALTAIGGGVTRDVILNVTPPRAFANPIYITVALVASLIVVIFAMKCAKIYFKERGLLLKVINILDSIGLGFFCMVGVETAIIEGHGDNGFVCVLMGLTTGIGGGILRDLFLRHIPGVLVKHIYALAAIAGSTLSYILYRQGADPLVAKLCGVAVIILIRMLATHYHWNLPQVHPQKK